MLIRLYCWQYSLKDNTQKYLLQYKPLFQVADDVVTCGHDELVEETKDADKRDVARCLECNHEYDLKLIRGW